MANARIVITDEVNCKITGLDLDTRKELVKKFKYFQPGARYQSAFQLGRWDGCISFFGLGGVTYVSLLDRILPIIESKGYYIEVEDLRKPVTLEFDQISEDYWGEKCWPIGHRFAGEPIRLRDDQVTAVNNFLSNPQSLQELATGFGKCQPLSSKVLTSSGWKLMKDIVVGEQVVTPIGKTAKVLNTFEPGIKDIFEITFSDGRTARCCEDHIWKIYNIDWKRSQAGAWRLLATSDIIKLLQNTKRAISVPLVTMIDDNIDVELPIDPWLMGFLLGDGKINNKELKFSTSDNKLLEKVKSKLLPEYAVAHSINYDYSIRLSDAEAVNVNNGGNISEKNVNSSAIHYIQSLMSLGLMETGILSESIPEIYFTGSHEQRMELVRGLVDSNCTIVKSNVVFTSTSKELASGFQKLIYSVGGIAKLTHLDTRTKIACEDVYRVSTEFPEPWKLTSLQQKINKTKYCHQYGSTLKLNIKNIEKVSREPVKCIYIDDPQHLYVTDDYIVTHNTILSATLCKICEKYGRTIIIVPNKSLVEQTEEDFVNVGMDVGVFYGDRKDLNKTHTICTWQSLGILNKKTKNGVADLITLAEFLEDVSTVIVDEVHQASANILKSLLTQNIHNAPIRWGITGTIPKDPLDFESIRCSLGEVIGKMSAYDLQQKGVLSGCHVNIVQTQEWREFRSYPEEVKYLVTDVDRLTWMSSFIKGVAETGNTLVLVDRIDCGKFLQNELNNIYTLLKEEPDVKFISGVVKSKDRKIAYGEIATSNNKITIATYGVASVGINIPRIFNLVLIEPGKSFVRVIQSIGRGIRKAEDKDFVNIYDMTANTKYAKRHLLERKKFYKDAKYEFTVEKVDITKQNKNPK